MPRPAKANCRTVPATFVRYQDIRRKFSCFRFVESGYENPERPLEEFLALRRMFSQVRNLGGKGMIVEEIPPAGAVAAEIEELQALFEDYEPRGLQRLSFWRRPVGPDSLSDLRDEDVLGYAILKRDHVPGKGVSDWHVFESVFVKDPYPHGYVPGAKTFVFAVGPAGQSRTFPITGTMFCEQNGLNKSCAQVAIRSLCAETEGDGPTYTTINDAARNVSGKSRDTWRGGKGLSSDEIRGVVIALGFGIVHVNYEEHPEQHESIPYQRNLYSGVEGGVGALLGFLRDDGDGPPSRHLLPVFGHTFNKNAWVPRSSQLYFPVRESPDYIPSDSWLSSFIVHDDSFGSNYWLPRFYIPARQVTYTAGLIRPRMEYSAHAAELVVYSFIRRLLRALPEGFRRSRWFERFNTYTVAGQLVLRPVPITGRQYLEYLRGLRDWEYRREDPATYRSAARPFVKDRLYWLVELSLPELFPTNLRKLGEVVLDATVIAAGEDDLSQLVLARIVDYYFTVGDPAADSQEVVWTRGQLRSHTGIIYSDSLRGAARRGG